MRISHGYILLKDLRFQARHGVGAQETLVGNEFTVNLRLRTDLTKAVRTDDVADTLSYADVSAMPMCSRLCGMRCRGPRSCWSMWPDALPGGFSMTSRPWTR